MSWRENLQDALAELALGEPRDVTRLGGGRSNAVWRIELDIPPLAAGARSPSRAPAAGTFLLRRFAATPPGVYVLKQALTAGSILALGAYALGPQPYPLAFGARSRIARETAALRALHAAGASVPRVFATSANCLLLEHVRGEPLPQTLTQPGAHARIAAYRAALDAVHATGFVLNDAHPGNALVDGDRVTLIDLEFAERCTDPARRAFDLAYAASYFTEAERDVFGAAPVTGVYAPLFAYERERQRRAS